MPKREVIQSIILGRENQRITLTAGQVFDFTDSEIAQITKASPGAISSKVTIDLDGDVDATEALQKREVDLDGRQVAPPDAGDKATSGKRRKSQDAEL